MRPQWGQRVRAETDGTDPFVVTVPVGMTLPDGFVELVGTDVWIVRDTTGRALLAERGRVDAANGWGVKCDVRIIG